MYSVEELQKLANNLRLDVLRSIHKVGSGHPGGSLSAAEMITALYFYKMNIDPKNPKWPDRDRFLLSKGHAVPTLFAALAHLGYFDISEMDHFRLHDGRLQATPNLKIPGCESVSGSLGQNMSMAIGIALAGKMDGRNYKTYVMVGDGEMEEGQNWEAIMSAPNFKLGNLVAILDQNHVQMCGTIEEIMPEKNFDKIFEDFGWRVLRCDGHDIADIIKVLDEIPNDPDGQPTFIISDTVKGKGVSFMEGKAAWHGGCPTKEQMAQIEEELGGKAL